ncbi:MAG: FAD:protein FMN transferase, partial [Gammaproteobacteria bacterium]
MNHRWLPGIHGDAYMDVGSRNRQEHVFEGTAPAVGGPTPGRSVTDLMMFVRKLALITFSLSLSACDNATNQPLEFGGDTMGTTYSVTITPPYPDTVTELETKTNSLLEDINAKMSTYIPDSELSIINQSDTNDWIPVSDALFNVISTAGEISKKSAGAFDITIGAVVNLWGFGPVEAGPQPPDKEAIAGAMQAAGYRQLETMA